MDAKRLALQDPVEYPSLMDVKLRYRGREVTDADIAFIELIAAHPGASRRVLSKLLCEAWGWRQANGHLRDMVCRGLMLTLHRAGWIELPPTRQNPPNNVIARRRVAPILVERTLLRTRPFHRLVGRDPAVTP
jgi:hypothetical protein